MFILVEFVTSSFMRYIFIILNAKTLIPVTSFALLFSCANFFSLVPKGFLVSGTCWCCAPHRVSFRSRYDDWEGLIVLNVLLILWNKIPHYDPALISEGQHSHGDAFDHVILVYTY